MKNLLAKKEFQLTGIKAILHVCAGILCFILSGSVAELVVFSIVPQKTVAVVLSSLLRIVLLFLLLSLYCKKVLRISLRECRVSKPKSLGIWILCAILLPLLVSAFFIFLTPGKWEVHNIALDKRYYRLTAALFKSCLAAGITEELVFRGFIMRMLEARWGKVTAVLAPSILFGALHIPSMGTFHVADALLLLVAGTSVGIMFSMIVYQSGSIWASALVHGIWNLIIIGKVLDISTQPARNSLYAYTLYSDATFLTGGSFGIEASLPVVFAYGLVFLLAFMMYRQRKGPINAVLRSK